MDKRNLVALMAVAATGAAVMLAGPAAHADAMSIKPAPAAGSATIVEERTDAGEAASLRLEAYESRFRKMPSTTRPHNYKMNVSTRWWSAVAAWSPAAGDVDLHVYDDKGHTQFLASSSVGTGMTDFVAIDSNHRDLGTYFPQVRTFSGTGSYFVEYASGGDTLYQSMQVPMESDDVVAVYDTYLVSGVTYTITLAPGNSMQDGDLFLVGSSPNDPSTWVRNRVSALRTGASHGIGESESFTFTPTATDYYGVVIINEALGGTFTLTSTAS